MKRLTTVKEREAFYQQHQQGESYETIAKEYGVSTECVGYWCRRQAKGGDSQNHYASGVSGWLSQFEPIVRYVILRLKLAHPRWGPSRIRWAMGQRPSLQGKRLPKDRAIGHYLHQWSRFHRPRKPKGVVGVRPPHPQRVHECWQIDFKVDWVLRDKTRLLLHTVRDPVGEVCIGAMVFANPIVNQQVGRVTIEQVQTVLRDCFTRWKTLPDCIQTDGEARLVAKGDNPFPSDFTLWLAGLGITHQRTRPRCPTDNAEVERCHRTLNEFVYLGNEALSLEQFQVQLSQAIHQLAFELPSWADGCRGRTPIQAHPELLIPRRPFQPCYEVATFDLQRVDTFLARFRWIRKASAKGQVSLGRDQLRYTVGAAYALQIIRIRFDPTDRHLVFYLADKPDIEIGRKPLKNLSVQGLTGLFQPRNSATPQQLPLPF